MHQQPYLEITSPNSQVFRTAEVRTGLSLDMAHSRHLKLIDLYERMRIFTGREKRAEIERLRNRFQSAPQMVAI